MAGADSNRVKIRYSTETTWGETPASPGTTEMRALSETLEHEKSTVVSDELRSDRQRTALLETGQAASGDIGFEFSYGSYETFLANALRGTIASATVTDASTTFTSAAITGGTGTDYVGAGFTAGQHVRINSTGDSNDGAIVKISSLTSTVLNIIGTTLTPSVASSAITGRTIVNGTTDSSYFIEVDFEDITAVKYFTGSRISEFSLEVASQEIITGTMSLMCKRGFAASTTVASTVVTSAGTTTPLTAAVNVGTIFENDTALTNAVQSMSLAINNNMRERPQVASKTSAEHGDGSIDVTGSVNVYFEDITLYSKMIDHTSSSLSMRFTDSSVGDVIISLPEIKFSNGNPSTPGLNQDVFIDMEWTAYRDSTTGNTIRVDMLPA